MIRQSKVAATMALAYALALAITCSIVSHGHAEAPFAFTTVLEKASREKMFKRPTAVELREVEMLFVRTFLLAAEKEGDARQAPRFDELRSQWNGHQMRLRRWDRFELDGGDLVPIWILSEEKNRRVGRGFYVFLVGNLRAAVIEAPHSFYDKHTRTIAEKLFRSGQFAACGWNTVKRSVVDVAHARFHYMNAFTRATLAAHPGMRTVQLHGYSASKRESAAGMSADVILSNGTEHPHAALTELQQRLQTAWPRFNVLAFPNDVRELGATKNVQAQLLRELAPNHFLHMEMSREFRLSIASDATVRAEFLKALLATCRR